MKYLKYVFNRYLGVLYRTSRRAVLAEWRLLPEKSGAKLDPGAVRPDPEAGGGVRDGTDRR